MAVSAQEIRSLREQQAALSESLAHTKAELQHTRQSLLDEQLLALDALRSEAAQRIESHDRKTRAQYEALLTRTASAQQAALEAAFAQQQAEYESVTRSLRTALAQEQRQAEELLLHQKAFEQAYFLRQKTAKAQAEASKRQAEQALQQAAEETPIECFFPGHLELYRTRLWDAAGWMEQGLFESVIGVCETVSLNLSLDVLETEKQFRGWMHEFLVVRSLLRSMRELLFGAAVKVPDDLVNFRKGRDVRDGVMGDASLAYWSDGTYQPMTEQYAAWRERLLPFEQDGVLLPEEGALRQRLIRDPGTAQQFPAAFLYEQALKLTGALSDAEDAIRKMRSRMRAFEERMVLLQAVRDSLSRAGYPVSETRLLGRPGDPLLISFCDDLRTMSFEIMFVPVLRRADAVWVNQAVCCHPAGCTEERRTELLHLLSGIFAAHGIEVAFQPMRVEQTTQERLKIAVSDLQLKINGRLN